MKKYVSSCMIVSLFLLFLTSNAFAYTACDTNNPLPPCTYIGVDYDEYVISDMQHILLYNHAKGPGYMGTNNIYDYTGGTVAINNSQILYYHDCTNLQNCGFTMYDTAYNTQVVVGNSPPYRSEDIAYVYNTSQIDFPANPYPGFLPTPFFRYPVDFTLDNPNSWGHKVQSFGSLNNNRGGPHAGEDWNKTTGGCTDAGESLYAIAGGTVTDITTAFDEWGKTILIRHDAPQGKYFLTGKGEMLSTVYSLYGHMLIPSQTAYGYAAEKDIQKSENDPIAKNDPIGQVGDGSGSYSPNACHLHFAILTNGSIVNNYRNSAYGWNTIQNYTDPSELINNGLYSDQSTVFSIIVHPYECSGAFKLNNNAPACSNPPSAIGNWTRRGVNVGNYELGYSGIIYSKTANKAGTALWTPNLPKDGQYRVSVYIPAGTYSTSHYATYTVSTNNNAYTPQTINQSIDRSGQQNPFWAVIGTYNLYKTGNSNVFLQGNTAEAGKVIAVDAVKFEYVGPIQ